MNNLGRWLAEISLKYTGNNAGVVSKFDISKFKHFNVKGLQEGVRPIRNPLTIEPNWMDVRFVGMK